MPKALGLEEGVKGAAEPCVFALVIARVEGRTRAGAVFAG